MKKVALFSLLLVMGMVLSQLLPHSLDSTYTTLKPWVIYATMAALAYIMINVGREFEIDKSRLAEYRWDYLVAMTAATFPWIFVVLYFVFVLSPPELWHSDSTWREMLLLGRFAAPTSAGVLFTMLAAAGLSGTWMFAKARILAIFDDLDTVLLMIPLTIMMIGLTWQLGVILAVMSAMLLFGYRNLRTWSLPCTWPWLLTYALIIAAISKSILLGSLIIDPTTPIHIEVLLPAFLLGCMLKPDNQAASHDQGLEQANTAIAAIFMVLVGLSMPELKLETSTLLSENQFISDHSRMMILFHVIMVTLLSNLGKMFPLLCYRREASLRERLALSIGMFPRGEVGAGILIISLGYGIEGQALIIAMLSLALNLLLTGFFIIGIRNLLQSTETEAAETTAVPHAIIQNHQGVNATRIIELTKNRP